MPETGAFFFGETWSLLVPRGWRAWHDDACTTLMADEEVGALQISAAFKDSEVVDADLRDFAADRLEAGAKVRPSQAGDFEGFEIAFSDGKHFQRQWYLRNRKQMLFVTYTCSRGSQGVEDGSVESILASLAAR